MEKVLEAVVAMVVMVFVMLRNREVHLVPKVMGTISGVLGTLAMLAAGAPTGASVATGLLVATILGEIGDAMIERHL